MLVMRKNVFKKAMALVLVLVLSMGWVTPVLADNTPFRGYTYNHWGVIVPTPAAYVPMRSFMAADICESWEAFVEPTDLHVSPCGYLFVVDSGNDRIAVFTESLEPIRMIYGFNYYGAWETFNRPNGVFVTWDREIYIADTFNDRIVVLDWYGEHIINMYGPTQEDLMDEFLFRPLSILVDRGGRVYVIVQHVFEGIMNFNAEGDFLGYFGTIEVWLSPLQIFWRFFMTDAQLQRQNRIIPTVFQAMALDEYNFVFTTNIEAWGSDQVMRLNPRGEDVLLNMNDNVSINGDQRFATIGALAGPSQFIDIIARPHGKFSALDSTRGRVYTYDNEGNLLYVFGGMGSMEGMMRRPVALEVLDEYIFILDAHLGRIVQFVPTEYGSLINHAIAMRYVGNDEEAITAWRSLVAIDEHFQLAWAGIGRGMLAEGNNVAAMYYLRRGMDMMHYSIAFRRHRLDVMQNILPMAFTVGTVLAGLFIAYKLIKVVRKRVAEA